MFYIQAYKIETVTPYNKTLLILNVLHVTYIIFFMSGEYFWAHQVIQSHTRMHFLRNIGSMCHDKKTKTSFAFDLRFTTAYMVQLKWHEKYSTSNLLLSVSRYAPMFLCSLCNMQSKLYFITRNIRLLLFSSQRKAYTKYSVFK